MSANKEKKEATTLVVAYKNNPGPKSTAVYFLVTDGIRPWAWLPNALVTAQNIRAGVTLEVSEVVAFGNPKATYENDGIQYENTNPKQQLMLGGNITITQPTMTAVSPLVVV